MNKEPRPVRPSELSIQRMCLARLGQVEFAFFWRANTGAARAGKHFIRFGFPGQADVLGVYLGRFVAFEIKTPVGQLSADQLNFKRRVEQAGGAYFCARTWEDCEHALERIRTGSGGPTDAATGGDERQQRIEWPGNGLPGVEK